MLPIFFTFGNLTVLKNFELIFGGNLVPFSDMIKIAGLIGLGAFLVMKTKERAVLLLEIAGKQIQNWRSFLAAKKTSLGKVFAFSGWLDFLLFAIAFASGSAGRRSIRLGLQRGNSADRCDCSCSLNDFWIHIARSEIWDRVGNRAFHDVVLNVAEEPCNKFDYLQNEGDCELRSVVAMLDQVVIHQIGQKSCKLRQNLMQHVLKKLYGSWGTLPWTLLCHLMNSGCLIISIVLMQTE